MKIAIVGLTPADTLIIKSYFAKFAPQVEIEWLGLDSAHADALIFRAKFLHTPTIESWIRVAPENASIAAIYRNMSSSEDSREAGVHLLDLSNRDPDALKAWIELIVQKQANAASVRKAFAEAEETLPVPNPTTFSKAFAEAEKTVLAQETPVFKQPPAADQSSIASQPAQASEDNGKIVEQFAGAPILQAVRRGTGVIVSSSGYLAYLHPKESKVWANHPGDTIPPIDGCQWQALRGDIPDNMPVVVDLRQWLWESLWNSTIDFTSLVQEDASYQLKVWPQPRGAVNRNVPLRIAALLQKGPASITALAQLTQIPVERVKKLLYTMQLVGFAQPVAVSQAQQAAEHNRLAQPAKDEKKMGIFKRIREKFNLFSS